MMISNLHHILNLFLILRWMCTISGKIGVKAFDLILERQRLNFGPGKCFSDDEVIKICTTMLESEQVKFLSTFSILMA